MIRALPLAGARIEPPRLVERSSPERPGWLDGADTSADGIGFVGEGAAATLDEARVRAERDLFAAVAAYVAAEVASEFEVVETHATRDGEVTEESVHVHEQKTSRAGEMVRRLQPDGLYWQEVAGTDGTTFHYAVHATVPRAHIELARFRHSDASKAWVLLLVTAEAGAPDLTAALRAELANQLETEAGFRVLPPALVDRAGAADEKELLSLLAPDVLVRVSIRDLGRRLEVFYGARWAASEAGATLGRVQRSRDRWLELQDAVVDAVRTDVTAVVTTARAP